MKFLRGRLARMITIIVSLIFIATLSRSILNIWQKGDIVRERAGELAKVEAENARLKKKLTESQSPEFIERQAREKLGLTKPGESVILMPAATEAGEFFQNNEIKALSNWQQWWKLFF